MDLVLFGIGLFFIIAVHELGHWVPTFYYGHHKKTYLTMWGLRTDLTCPISVKKYIFINLAGLIASIPLALGLDYFFSGTNIFLILAILLAHIDLLLLYGIGRGLILNPFFHTITDDFEVGLKGHIKF